MRHRPDACRARRETGHIGDGARRCRARTRQQPSWNTEPRGDPRGSTNQEFQILDASERGARACLAARTAVAIPAWATVTVTAMRPVVATTGRGVRVAAAWIAR